MKIRVKKYLSEETHVVGVSEYLQDMLLEGAEDGGVLEGTQQNVRNVAEAFGHLVDKLCADGVLDAKDVPALVFDWQGNSEVVEFVENFNCTLRKGG